MHLKVLYPIPKRFFPSKSINMDFLTLQNRRWTTSAPPPCVIGLSKFIGWCGAKPPFFDVFLRFFCLIMSFIGQFWSHFSNRGISYESTLPLIRFWPSFSAETTIYKGKNSAVLPHGGGAKPAFVCFAYFGNT